MATRAKPMLLCLRPYQQTSAKTRPPRAETRRRREGPGPAFGRDEDLPSRQDAKTAKKTGLDTLTLCDLGVFARNTIPCSILCETKPIRRSPAGIRGADCAKRTQFAGSARKGQVVCDKRVMTNGTCPGPGQNEANFRRRRAGRGPGDGDRGVLYKQSQFGEARPASGGRLCKTNPIRRKRQGGASSVWQKSYDELDLPVARAKRSQFPAGAARRDGWHRHPRRRRHPSCETKPICHGSASRVAGCQGRKGCLRWGQACETRRARQKLRDHKNCDKLLFCICLCLFWVDRPLPELIL